mmetsp:Transcript_20024/g.34425  ORF Transcript_20024/g.34425 Transcript_20024/m.34425 type:complete len:269 (+) Transcript_20024:516-1322(+)|eukprot:CAMPEP_0196664750 /NCGR_PEP_ID=MMETSP1086-20130531/58229_1 /TAXON_ID=77921 /ORGANISM="Cyanoptyche  gloeocystis , Strain SAG4.97" /LENGTH=268 /DNA_ID=CAMNT_0042001175 /DNA_START=511 /DNA_END=1317 /DNA_ORIENTATION=-
MTVVVPLRLHANATSQNPIQHKLSKRAAESVMQLRKDRKPQWMSKFLSQLPSDDIVVFMDGFDTLIQQSKEYFLALYEQHFNNLIVVSTEKSFWPFNLESCSSRSVLESLFPDCPGCAGSRFVNSGALAGPVKYLLPLFSEPVPLSTQDDQARLAAQFLSKRHPILLDQHSYLFQSMHGAADDIRYVENAKLSTPSPCYVHRHDDFMPWLLHYNGLRDTLPPFMALKLDSMPLVEGSGFWEVDLTGFKRFVRYSDTQCPPENGGLETA